MLYKQTNFKQYLQQKTFFDANNSELKKQIQSKRTQDPYKDKKVRDPLKD